MQVLTVRVIEPLSDSDLEARLRETLPKDLGVVAVRTCGGRLHAQHSAIGKEYRYRIANQPNVAWANASWSIELDERLFEEALRRFVGTHDFSAFHHHSSATRSRTIWSAELRQGGHGLLDVAIVGDGFARYQIRYLVAAAVAVARGERSLADLDTALHQQRSIKLVKAPAAGLVLWNVRYPPELDPFDATLRRQPPGLPAAPPFAGLTGAPPHGAA